MKQILLIKLGGSIISDKSKVNKARTSNIKKISRQIKEISDKDNNLSFLLFTGAGGFGHPVAKRFKNKLKEGIKEIKSACKEINKIVVDTLINQSGLKAVSVTPSDIAEYENGSLTSLSYDQLILSVEKDIIPVFHADLVDDKKRGISILSMDKFLVDVAIYFNSRGIRVEKAIFVGTTPVLATSGVTKGPLETVKTITKTNYFSIKKNFYQGKEIDVSGGMKFKVEQCLRLADKRIKSHITDNLYNPGTTILY